MQDRAGYAARVLDATTLPLPTPEEHGPILPGILRGLGSAAAAVALATVALAWRPRRSRQQGKEQGTNIIEGALRGLRQLHSGRIGDYVTWLTVGVAAFGALFAALLR